MQNRKRRQFKMKYHVHPPPNNTQKILFYKYKDVFLRFNIFYSSLFLILLYNMGIQILLNAKGDETVFW